MTCVCSPGRESAMTEPSSSEEHMRLDPKKILEQASRYIDILRARKPKPDPLMDIAIQRLQTRLDEIHTEGRKLLPAPTSAPLTFDIRLTRDPYPIERKDNA